MASLNITVSYKGISHPLEFDPQTPFAALKETIEGITNVPSALQKLLYRGKKAVDDDTTLEDAGFKDNVKVTLIGTTNEELEKMKGAEAESSRREAIMRQRRAQGPTKVFSTSKPSDNARYRFHRIEPLPHLPNPGAAKAVLERLAADPAIQHVMVKHKFAVGLLTELAPHEHPELLGLNTNAGENIKLRIRTDAYDGMRLYKDVRRVLCLELTHNVWGDHDNKFKELNSQLNREVEAFERDAEAGTHTLTGSGDYYEPAASTRTDAEAHSHVLGGSGASSTLLGSRDEMRARALEAAMARKRKQDQEIEEMCGSSGPAASGSQP